MPRGTILSDTGVKGKLKDYTPEERWKPSDAIEIKVFQQGFKFKVVIKTEDANIEFIQFFLPEVLHKMAHFFHALSHTAQSREAL